MLKNIIESKKKPGMWLAIFLVPLTFVLSATVADAKSCFVGEPDDCETGFVCAKIDASGKTECLRHEDGPIFVPLFPFKAENKVICTQSGRQGNRSYSNNLYAIDLTSPYDKPASEILAGEEGIAFVFDTCKDGPGKPAKTKISNCGAGLGNHVRILHQTGHVSIYAHLAKVFVKDQQFVTRGQVIGLEGSTGAAGHRHLQWDVHKLPGRDRSEWKRMLANPGQGGRSIKWEFVAVVNDVPKLLRSDKMRCALNNMAQAPLSAASPEITEKLTQGCYTIACLYPDKNAIAARVQGNRGFSWSDLLKFF